MTATEMEDVLKKLDLRSSRVEQILQTLATRDDLKVFPTRDDLKVFPTRDDLNVFATRDDLKVLATKEDLKAYATREDLKVYATREDLKVYATKEDLKTGLDGVREEMKQMGAGLKVLIEANTETLGLVADHLAAFSRRLPPDPGTQE